MIIPPLCLALRPWLFLAIGVPLCVATMLLIGVAILIALPFDADDEPLNLEDLDA